MLLGGFTRLYTATRKASLSASLGLPVGKKQLRRLAWREEALHLSKQPECVRLFGESSQLSRWSELTPENQ